MECMYCAEESRQRESLMERLCLLPFSTVYVFKNQSYYGRCVVAFRGRHCSELFELNDIELSGFMKDVADVARAVKKIGNAAKINYAIYGDLVSHVHFHVVPKINGGFTWGEAFTMSTDNAVHLSEEAWVELKQKLICELQQS